VETEAKILKRDSMRQGQNYKFMYLSTVQYLIHITTITNHNGPSVRQLFKVTMKQISEVREPFR
jgi:hypothetical protein